MGTMEKALIHMVPVQQACRRSVSGAIAGSQCADWRATLALWAATLLHHLLALSGYSGAGATHHVLSTHLACACKWKCIGRSAWAARGVACGAHSNIVAGLAMLRGAAAAGGQPAVAAMLQQLISRHCQWRLCAGCAHAQTRGGASDTCAALKFRAARAPVA